MTAALVNAPTVPVDGPIRAIGSFYYDGKYCIYWKHGYDNYKSHTALFIDLQAQGTPITTSSIRIADAFVDSNENVYVLLPYTPPETTVIITEPK